MKTAYEQYRAELDAIREAGIYKDERIITTPQRSRIDTTAAKAVVNMCANNYLGLSDDPRLIAAANKSDCAPRWDAARLSAHFDSVCIVSAREKTGLDALGAAVAAAFPMPEADSGEILTNARQADAVRRALEYLRGAREAMAAGFAPDAVLTECEGAMDALGALSGRSVREDVTQEIFSRFCVGK